jgi:Arc/MetJ family transcription regulator
MAMSSGADYTQEASRRTSVVRRLVVGRRLPQLVDAPAQAAELSAHGIDDLLLLEDHLAELGVLPFEVSIANLEVGEPGVHGSHTIIGTRTTLDLDELLLQKAMVVTKTRTKTAVIERGLRELVVRTARESLAALYGSDLGAKAAPRRHAEKRT